jgi:serine/threonine protein kinase
LVDKQGVVTLIDFDAAFDWSMETCVSQTVGTLPYIAPELLQGGPMTAAIDMWSLGIILLQMVQNVEQY